MSNFRIDPIHSEILFKAKHLMITNMSGSFGVFDANMQADADDFSDAVISFSADISSIKTKNVLKDNHLKSDYFFGYEQNPTMNFQSSSIEKKSGKQYLLNGAITIKAVIQPITLQVEYTGKVTDHFDQEKSGFESTGELYRKDFGLNWSAVTNAGGIVVSDEVRLMMSI